MNHLRSERGITLVELMIVVFTAGMLCVMAMGTLLNISGTSSTFSANLDAEIEELQAANTAQLVFSQATELNYFGNASLNNYTDFVTGQGQIRDYDSDAVFGSFPPVETLAIFMRDSAASSLTAPSTVSSNLRPTAVYFQKPTPTTWGVLYFSLGDQPILAPVRAGAFYEGLIRVRILNVTTYTPSTITIPPKVPVTSFDLELTFRRFIGDVPNEARMFCPASALAACPQLGAHKDVSRIFKLTIRNNVLDESPNSPAPRRGARMYDLVHFFGLGRKGALR
jgi:type II secretory pathway pseudopilin PulG